MAIPRRESNRDHFRRFLPDFGSSRAGFAGADGASAAGFAVSGGAGTTCSAAG
jgi:hypothetical protein